MVLGDWPEQMEGECVQHNTAFCIAAGVLSEDDARRLLGKLEHSPKVLALADEFTVAPAVMAGSALDAGLAFLWACLLMSVSEAPGMVFSPSPVADAGWDELADVSHGTQDWQFYVGVCQRFSEVLGVPPVVIRHATLTSEQGVAARDLGAIRNVVRVMNAQQIHYVPAHWPLDADVTCEGQGNPPCRAHIDGLSVPA